jgi:hypothetical protein
MIACTAPVAGIGWSAAPESIGRHGSSKQAAGVDVGVQPWGCCRYPYPRVGLVKVQRRRPVSSTAREDEMETWLTLSTSVAICAPGAAGNMSDPRKSSCLRADGESGAATSKVNIARVAPKVCVLCNVPMLL